MIYEKKSILIILFLFLFSTILVMVFALKNYYLHPIEQKSSLNLIFPDTEIKKVVFVTIDTLKADHLGFMGYSRNTSTFLDDLASSSILFKNAYSPSPLTLPSHTSMFTGKHPSKTNVLMNFDKLDSSEVTLAEHLKENGFVTGAILSSNIFASSNINQGFDYFNYPRMDLENNIVEKDYEKRIDLHGRSAEKAIDLTIEWLKKNKNEDKIFLWLHLYDPHVKMLDQNFDYIFSENDIRDESNLIQYFKNYHNLDLDYLTNNPVTPFNSYKLDEKKEFTKKEIENIYLYLLSKYDGGIQEVDNQLQRLYKYFEEIKINNEALWLILPDHGLGLGNHNIFQHGKGVYDDQVLTPIIIHKPYAFNNKVVQQTVRNFDIFPTILDVINIEKGDLSGVSLKEFLVNNKRGTNRDVFFISKENPFTIGVKKDGYKLIQINYLENNEKKYRKFEFYNLITDIIESDNLISDNNYKEIIDKLKYDKLYYYSLLIGNIFKAKLK